MGTTIPLTPDRLIDLDHFRVSKIPKKVRSLYPEQREHHRYLLNQADGTWDSHVSQLTNLRQTAEDLICAGKSSRPCNREIEDSVKKLENSDGIQKILNPIDRELFNRSLEIMKESLEHSEKSALFKSEKNRESIDLTAIKLGRFLNSLHAKYMQPLRDISLEKAVGIKPKVVDRETLRAMSIGPRDENKAHAA